MQLYPISKKLELIQMQAEESGGEVTSEQADEYFKAAESFEAACVDVGKLIKGLEAEHEGIEFEVERLTTRQGAIKDRIRSLRKHTAFWMLKLNIVKVKDALFSLSAREGKSKLVIADESKIPGVYFKAPPPPPPPQLDKKMLHDALDTGVVVEGACLGEGDPILTIR